MTPSKAVNAGPSTPSAQSTQGQSSGEEAVEGSKSNTDPRHLSDELSIAIMKGTFEEVEALLDAGADPNGTNILGVSPLFTAAMVGNMAKFELLLARGADPHETSDTAANTALFSATNFGRRDIADRMVLLGADLNAPNKDGHTLLMKAALDAKAMAAQTLLEMGADHRLKAPCGRTASQIANDLAAQSLLGPAEKGMGARRTAHNFNVFLAREYAQDALNELAVHTLHTPHTLKKGLAGFSLKRLSKRTPKPNPLGFFARKPNPLGFSGAHRSF